MSVTLKHGDALALLREMPDASVDAVVTDPPYGLKFMGRKWDHGVPSSEVWAEVLRVAKPGAHLCAFGGTRTYHRLAVAIEDAGWEIRDCLMWLYGSGFPKSLDVSKAIDKDAGAEREKVRVPSRPASSGTMLGKMETRPWIEAARAVGYHEADSQKPITPAAITWQGYGTALKPAWEPIILARKPLRGTVAANVLTYGTGALNIDACRIAFVSDEDKAAAAAAAAAQRAGQDQNAGRNSFGDFTNAAASIAPYIDGLDRGRWPANVAHDGSDEVVALFPEAGGGFGVRWDGQLFGSANKDSGRIFGFGDTGSAARFFYCGKATPAERAAYNNHPTVKPVALMHWLCTLVGHPGATVLDPFMGSGSTGIAATRCGFHFVGFDLDEKHVEISRRRIVEDAPLINSVSMGMLEKEEKR